MQIRQKPNAITAAACVLILVLGISMPWIAGSADAAGDRRNSRVAGWVETAWFLVGEVRFSLDAKLDTGARSSSINAPDYREFHKDGRIWIAFEIIRVDGMAIDVQAPLMRMASICRAGDQIRQRPVIAMSVCIAGITSLTEFTLADRSAMDYQVLIGRNLLENGVLVDSARKFVATGRC